MCVCVDQVTIGVYEMCGEYVYRCVGMKKPRLQLRAFKLGGRIFTQSSSEINGHGDPEGHGNDNKPADVVIICISLYLFGKICELFRVKNAF